MRIPGNAIEDEGVLLRMKSPGTSAILDELMPELDGRLIGD
jgi:hypothetical protein